MLHNGSQTPANYSTPKQSPTRSVKPHSSRIFNNTAKMKRGTKKCLPSVHPINNTRKLSNTQIGYNEDKLMAQYDFIVENEHHNYNLNEKAREETKETNKEPTFRPYPPAATETGARRMKWKSAVPSTGIIVLTFLIGFSGGMCYSYMEQIWAEWSTPPAQHADASTDIVLSNSFRLEQVDLQLLQLRSSMHRLTKELNSFRRCISHSQEPCSGVVPQNPRGILEELFAEQPDLASSGNLGSVLATPHTLTLTVPAEISVLGLLSFTLALPHRPPHTTIQGLIQEVGDCWAFSGQQGRLVLSLHQPSIVTGVSLSHIPSTLTLTGDIASAPRHFRVLTHRQENDLDSGLLLGEFEYSSTGPWRQTFMFKPSRVQEDRFRIVEFQFVSNHGNPDHTCVYRVHVHGKMFE